MDSLAGGGVAAACSKTSVTPYNHPCADCPSGGRKSCCKGRGDNPTACSLIPLVPGVVSVVGGLANSSAPGTSAAVHALGGTRDLVAQPPIYVHLPWRPLVLCVPGVG